MNECVILLHGLARTKRSMNKIADHLHQDGYKIFNIGYPSTKLKIETLAEATIAKALNRCKASFPDKIHFVTHSLGGILVRYYLNHHTIPRIGRTVMLSPPNGGSELVDRLGHIWLFKEINGPAGNQLGTDRISLPSSLGPIKFDTGIIAGCKTLNPFYSLLIQGENDGKVSISKTKLEGMKDFITVPHSHSFIMRSHLVCKQTSQFLKYGHFLK